MTFKKHQHVEYTARSQRIAAIVKRAHRDGTCTVEARFFLDAKGNATPGYIGHKYRMQVSDLSAPQGGIGP